MLVHVETTPKGIRFTHDQNCFEETDENNLSLLIPIYNLGFITFKQIGFNIDGEFSVFDINSLTPYINSILSVLNGSLARCFHAKRLIVVAGLQCSEIDSTQSYLDITVLKFAEFVTRITKSRFDDIVNLISEISHEKKLEIKYPKTIIEIDKRNKELPVVLTHSNGESSPIDLLYKKIKLEMSRGVDKLLLLNNTTLFKIQSLVYKLLIIPNELDDLFEVKIKTNDKEFFICTISTTKTIRRFSYIPNPTNNKKGRLYKITETSICSYIDTGFEQVFDYLSKYPGNVLSTASTTNYSSILQTNLNITFRKLSEMDVEFLVDCTGNSDRVFQFSIYLHDKKNGEKLLLGHVFASSK